MNKLLIAFFLIALLCACEGDYSISYEWRGMNVYNADNSSKLPTIYSGDSLKAATYCIKLDMNTVELSREGRYLDTETPPRNINRLDSLIITSTADFTVDYPAGTNLTPFFRILNASYFKTLAADGSEGYDITNIYSNKFYDEPNVKEINLLLMKLPELGNTHLFTVTAILRDSTLFSETTNPIKLY